MNQPAPSGPEEDGRAIEKGWLNRNVLGMGLTSFLADAGYETASAVLPGFLAALGAPAVGLGAIEGIADAVSSLVKLGTGWWGDRLGRRKGIVIFGYALSGGMTALFALAWTWPVILVGRTLAWFGRGIRGPLRNAILAESVPQAHRGKAFGFHQAGDTLGAILGPLLAWGLLVILKPTAEGDPTWPYRLIFWLSLIPGLGSALAFALFVREKPHEPNPEKKLWTSFASLPVDFKRWLVGVGIFGAGDFAHTLLMLPVLRSLAATHDASEAAGIAIGLYAWRNVFHSVASYGVGHLSDRLGRRGLLWLGYLLGGFVMAGFAAAFATRFDNLPVLATLFALAGVYLAAEDVLEKAMTADLVADDRMRGTAFGLMGAVNSLGDLVSSVLVGLLWDTVGFAGGFAYAAGMMFVGTVVIRRFR